MTFGEKIRDLRTTKEWSQEALAKMLGVSRRTVVAYEQGQSYPRHREVYEKLAEIFSVDVNYLRTENEEFLEGVGQQYGRRGQMQAQEILEQSRGLFAGGTLSPEDEIAFIQEIQQVYLDSKRRAKQKFTPKKYREAEPKADK